MTAEAAALSGVLLVHFPAVVDQRGWFSRLWCEKEMHAHGMAAHLSQCSLSFNSTRGTVRGLHYQAAPHAENKLVRCLSGAIYDVAVDLRPDSATYLHYFATELSAENGQALYVPAGCAHGFQTLTPAATVLYCIDVPYDPASARRARYNDPAFAIRWPLPVADISQADRDCPDYSR